MRQKAALTSISWPSGATRHMPIGASTKAVRNSSPAASSPRRPPNSTRSIVGQGAPAVKRVVASGEALLLGDGELGEAIVGGLHGERVLAAAHLHELGEVLLRVLLVALVGVSHAGLETRLDVALARLDRADVRLDGLVVLLEAVVRHPEVVV